MRNYVLVHLLKFKSDIKEHSNNKFIINFGKPKFTLTSYCNKAIDFVYFLAKIDISSKIEKKSTQDQGHCGWCQQGASCRIGIDRN